MMCKKQNSPKILAGLIKNTQKQPFLLFLKIENAFLQETVCNENMIWNLRQDGLWEQFWDLVVHDLTKPFNEKF